VAFPKQKYTPVTLQLLSIYSIMLTQIFAASQGSIKRQRGGRKRRFLVLESFLPRDALQCKARYCDCMSSVRPSVRLWRWWIRPTWSGPHRLEILETNSTGNKPNIFALHSPKAIQLHPRPPTASSPLIGCSQPQPKTSTDITSGTCKATDFKLGQYIYRVHPNKSSEKKAWAHPETAQSFWIPLLSREQVKQRTSNFVSTFTGSIETKIHEKFREK